MIMNIIITITLPYMDDFVWYFQTNTWLCF